MAIDTAQIERRFKTDSPDVGPKTDSAELAKALEPKENFARRILRNITSRVDRFRGKDNVGHSDDGAGKIELNDSENTARIDLNQTVLREQAAYERTFREKFGVDMRTVPGVDEKSKILGNGHEVPTDEISEAHAANNMFAGMLELQGAEDWTIEERYKVGWFLDRMAGQKQQQLAELTRDVDRNDDPERQTQMQTLATETTKINELKQNLGLSAEPQTAEEIRDLMERQQRAAQIALSKTLFT